MFAHPRLSGSTAVGKQSCDVAAQPFSMSEGKRTRTVEKEKWPANARWPAHSMPRVAAILAPIVAASASWCGRSSCSSDGRAVNCCSIYSCATVTAQADVSATDSPRVSWVRLAAATARSMSTATDRVLRLREATNGTGEDGVRPVATSRGE